MTEEKKGPTSVATVKELREKYGTESISRFLERLAGTLARAPMEMEEEAQLLREMARDIQAALEADFEASR